MMFTIFHSGCGSFPPMCRRSGVDVLTCRASAIVRERNHRLTIDPSMARDYQKRSRRHPRKPPLVMGLCAAV
jgi:hypothetical protein